MGLGRKQRLSAVSITSNTNHAHAAKAVPASLHLLFPPSLHILLFGRNSLCSLDCGSWEIMLRLLGGGVSTSITWNSVWESCLLYLYLFIQSFIYIMMDSWVFLFYFRLYPRTILFMAPQFSVGSCVPFIVGFCCFFVFVFFCVLFCFV